MRGETVPQSMRGRRRGQAKPQPRPFHRLRHQPRIERPAAGAAEQRLITRHREGAEPQIIGHRLARRRKHRHQPFLVALAAHTQHLGQGRIRAFQRQSLGDPQPAAIHQRHHRRIARRDPGLLRLHLDLFQHLGRGLDAQRTGQLALIFRRLGRQHMGGVKAFARRQPADEILHRRKRPRQRPAGETAVALMRHPGPHVGLAKPGQLRQTKAFPPILMQKGQKSGHIGTIGRQRVTGRPVDRPQVTDPQGHRRPCGGRDPHRHQLSQRRMPRSNTPAKKASRSVPCEGLN